MYWTDNIKQKMNLLLLFIIIKKLHVYLQDNILSFVLFFRLMWQDLAVPKSAEKQVVDKPET